MAAKRAAGSAHVRRNKVVQVIPDGQDIGGPGRVVKPEIQLPELLYKIAADSGPFSMIG
jgi:hypothetical protein